MLAYVYTLGCKVNQVESSEAETLLQKKGYDLVDQAAQADLILINTCTVTHVADRKSRQHIRRFQKMNPRAKLVLTGCCVEHDQADLPRYENSDIVPKEQLGDYLEQLGLNDAHQDSILPHSKIRKFLLLQKGCTYFCSYCIIPHVRSVHWTANPEDILTAAREDIKTGVREFVLTGINIGTFPNLPDFLKKLMALPGEFRVRMGSVEPNLVSDELIDMLNSEEKLCPHLHIPLQGGTDQLLKAMNRRYLMKDYHDLLGKLRSSSRNIAVTTDLIIGFPGESPKDFAATINLIQKDIFQDIHLFPYSRRKGTAADQMAEHLDPKLIKDRRTQAQNELTESRSRFLNSKIGTNTELLIEEIQGSNYLGYNPQYIKLKLGSNSSLSLGQTIRVKTTGIWTKKNSLGLKVELLSQLS